MHVLWLNESAALAGGCEHYVQRTAEILSARGVRSSILYDPNGGTEPAFLKTFEGAYPLVDVAEQVSDIAPDLIYVHRLPLHAPLRALASTRLPLVRFFHDHQLFCLRESKYTTLRHQTCTRTVGPACYPCLGFIRRADRWPGIRLTRVGTLQAEQRENRVFHAFVVASAYLADHAAAHGLDRSKFHVLPLYAPAPAASPSVTREHDLVLFAGSLLRGKGLDVLFRAMLLTQHPVRLIVAGRGQQEPMYRALCSRLGLTPRVEFVGGLSSWQLSDCFRKVACLVFPSRSPETFGLVGVEAMSHGTPVIASAVGGVTEWLGEGQTGLTFPANDSTALAQALDRLLGDPDLAHRMGARAREVFDQRFRPEAHITRLQRLFETLVKSRENE